MSRRFDSRESIEYVHPDPPSSDTPPSSPSDINSHPRRPPRESRSRSQPPAKRRSSRPSTATGTGTGVGDDSRIHNSTSSSRFLSRLMAREDHDSRKMSSLLLITNERLEVETTRANDAERKAEELIRRFREVVQSRDLAVQDSSRVGEELRLYKVQLENAQREIFRAQEIINQVAKEKHDAEEDAARARTKARQLQEEKLVMTAREEGRRLGFQEGLSRGRRIGFEEGRTVTFGEGPSRVIEDIVGIEPDQESIDIRRVRSPDSRRMRTPIAAPRPLRAPSRSGSRSQHNTHDTALHAPTLPVPTVATPLSVPSVTRAPARTPVPVPVSAPSRSPESIHPISIYNHEPSPVPHPSRVLRDGFIPTADRNSSFIDIPPPHELAAPIPSPQGSELDLPLPRPPPKDDMYAPAVHHRDFAYAQGSAPIGSRPRTASQASRGSTRISQYDLVSPPRGQQGESASRYAQSPRSIPHVLHRSESPNPRDNYYDRRERRSRTPHREEEVSPTQRIVDDWRSANPNVTSSSSSHTGAHAVPGRTQSPHHTRSPRVSGGPRRPSARDRAVPSQQHRGVEAATQQDMNRPRSPLDWLFRRRNRDRTYSSPSVPDIMIEPPSGSPSNDSVGTVAHPHLLTPDDANREMPLPGDDELNEFLEANENLQPPSGRGRPVILPDNQLPMGFVPLAGPTVMMASVPSRGQTPRLSEQYPFAPLPKGLSYPEPVSRPSTSFEVERPSANNSSSASSSRTRRRLFSAPSPAPLQRPISIFSEDT